MMQKALLALFMAAGTLVVSAQELYTPRDVKKAYQNNTRSKTGKPGDAYWQNKGVYDIKLTLDPPNRTVQGTETITYTNHSPDTLKALMIKLYLNNHRPGAARQGMAYPDYLTDGITIDSYSENGNVSEMKDTPSTNTGIKLREPLLPNQSVTLTFDWHFDMSVQSGREGAIDSTTFFLAYFYPRVAVYDDYNGWDQLTFTGAQEFYNDFNDYTFSVTVPKDFIVWATGDLQNTDEVLQPKYAALLKESMTSDEVIKIADQEDLKAKNITVQNEVNTWKWSTQNITDIAIAVSDHYNWDAGSVVVDKKTGRRASVQAAYDEPSKDFKEMVGYGKHSLDWFSNNYPGVPYPFSKSTIVRGFADMEYPMMVNDSSFPTAEFTRFVVEHEIAHTYFPFYMGINETRFGFMDEGWATALEYLIGIEDLGVEKATQNFKRFRTERWAGDDSMEEDIPIIIPSSSLTGLAMGVNEYGKAAIGYLAVKDLLGDEMFTKALHGYMDRWNGKHPIPWDFFYSFNDISGENLNWFWDSWFFSHGYIDIAITNVEAKRKSVTVTLENLGGMPAPVDVLLTLKDGTEKVVHQTPRIWEEDITKSVITINDVKDVVKVSLDGGIWMDADTTNNVYTVK
ncbi:M1 family metallopeptidase [Neptunitalea lumnitzerae]|uniref:Peptidase n=1 Tax=Neptunitalea lumnitzerae TaxID=2965509 RepID=A0ABQ5MLE0_9FLAO|nr:M1 family metallopeptidase [Neptunitalea sp. Y10]GLB50167.1 peptidase [Neptunitalea sp. Y10]